MQFKCLIYLHTNTAFRQEVLNSKLALIRNGKNCDTLEQQLTLVQQVNLDYHDEFNILYMNQWQISEYVVFGL